MVASIQISVFGIPRVSCLKTGRDFDLPRSALGLLIYLSTRPNQKFLREQICTELWPDIDAAKARSRLSTALWRLRKAFEDCEIDDPISADTDHSISLQLGTDIVLDLEEFEARARAFLTELDDLSWAESDEKWAKWGPPMQGWYEVWALAHKVRIEDLREACLLELFDRQLDQAHSEAALATGELILEIDPLRDDIYERMMAALLELGRNCQVQVLYDRCKEMLAKELDLEPGARLEKLRMTAKRLPITENLTTPRAANASVDLALVRDLLMRSQRDLKRAFEMLERSSS